MTLLPLLEQTTQVVVSAGAAAGTSNVNCSSVNLAEGTAFRGCRFTAVIGTLTATQQTALKVQGCNDNATWEDLAGSQTAYMLDADSNKTLIVDILYSEFQYLRAVVVRGTANAVVLAVLAELYGAVMEPVTQDASVSQYLQLLGPPQGTA